MTLNSALTTSAVDPDISAAMVVFERLQPLQDALGLRDLTVPEMQLFAMVAHHTGLDPFTKQIYAIKRGGRVTHQTGIDGYRSTAERTREYRGTDEATYEACECGSPESPSEHPKIARVVVYRAYPDGIRPQVGVARWHELKPDHYKPQGARDYLDQMWWDMPYNQLAKCAEAAGLRKAFPRVLGGVYITEEMQQAETIEGEARVVAPTVKERLAERRREAEAQTETASDDTQEVKAAIVQEAPAPPDSGSAPAEVVSPLCGAPSPYSDAQTCGLPKGHGGKFHRLLDEHGVVKANWE